MCSQKDTNVYSRHLDILIVSRYPYENTQTMQLTTFAGLYLGGNNHDFVPQLKRYKQTTRRGKFE